MNKRIRLVLSILSILLISKFSTAQTTFTVGSGGTHSTIQAAYNACTGAQRYNIEVRSTYTGGSETFPINLTQLANKSSTNSVNIYPQTGVTGFTFNKTTAIFSFNGADYVNIDGRAGRTGPIVWTLQNTTTAAGNNTIQFLNEATNNSVSYCNIYGSSTGTSASSAVVYFGTSTGTNGNGYNYIIYCTIGKDNISAMPYQAIASSSTAGKANTLNQIYSNNIINFSNKGIFIDSIPANLEYWYIHSNSFYQTANYTVGTPIVMMDIGCSSIDNYSANYFGGQAPLCAGPPFVIPSSVNSSFTAVLARGNLNNNYLTSTVSNISLTTLSSSGVPFIGIEVRGSGMIINGNIGNACTLINNSGGISLGIEGIRITGGASVQVTVGGFTLSGSKNGATSIMVNCLSGSTSINSSNIYGSTINSVSDLLLVNCEASASVSFNGTTVGGTTHNGTGTFTAIRNKSLSGISFYKSSLNTISLPNTAGTVELLGIDNQAGPLDINFSSFYNLTTANNAPLSVIKHTGTTLNLRASTFDTYTQSNAGIAGVLKVVNSNTSSAAVVTNNVFGNATAGNISTTANASHSIISSAGSGGLTANGNTFNGYAIGGAGNAVAFNSIFTTQGGFTCVDNIFQNFTINTTSTSDFATIYTTAATNTITNNTIKNIQFTNTTAVASSNRAMYLGGTGSATLSKNFITGLSSASTSTTAKILGIDIVGGSRNLYNNAIILNNNAATNAVTIYGIWCRNTTGANAIYHNSIKLFGSQTGNASSAAMIRTAAATNNVRNNVFQNLRTGGTLGHYAESTTATGYTTDFNYLEASNVNQLGSYAGGDRTLATWKTSTLANNSITGTTLIDNTGRQAAGFIGATSGTNLLVTVPDDRIGAARITTPALGAYQSSTTNISITSFSPQIGPIGTVVTINGTGFSSVTTNNVVRFGGMKAVVSASTPTQLTVTVPAGATYNTIVVVSNGLLVETTKPFHVTNNSNCVYFELPKIAGSGGYNGLVGDFNNDGNPDLFTKNSQTFRVLPGDGSGNYPTYAGYGLNSNSSTSQFETGDFNRDGLLDIIDLNYGASIFMNAGGGTFSAAEFTVATGGSTAMGDINKDGILDWVSVDGGSLIYAYGYGNSFGPYNYTSAPGSNYVQLADFNSDGYLDVVTSNDNSLTISIFLGSALGTYSTKTDYTTGTTGPYSSTIGDYDKDGDLDIAVANNNNKSFSVLLNSGLNTATFPVKVDYTATSDVKYVETADINGDGNLDLIIANEDEFTVSIFFGTGTGAFGTRQDFPVGTLPNNLTVGDFNKDGKQDLLCSDGRDLIVLLNTCTPPAPQITVFSPVAGVVGTTVTINGRYFDLTPANNKVYFGSVAAIVTASSSTQLTVTVPAGVAYDRISVVVNGLRVISKTHFNLTAPPVTCVTTTSFDPKVDLPAASNINSMVMGDLNGDGKNDLVSVNTGSNSVSVYMNTSVVGTISYAAPVNITTGASPNSAALGDIDGDGSLDMAVTNGSTNVTVYRNTGTGTFSAGVNFTTLASGAGLAIGDIDQDGKPDLVVGNNSISSNVSLFKNQSVSGTINASSFAAKYDQSARYPYNSFVTLNDFNNDGKMDIVVSQNSNGYVQVMRNTGISGTIGLSNGFDNFSPTTAGTSPKEVFSGDIDGDGKPDVVVVNSGGTNVSILRNTSNSITSIGFATKVDYTTANTPSAVAMGDIDGDGKSDILVANYGSNSMSVLKNNSTSGTINFAAKVDIVNGTGTNPAAIAVGDMDGDGKPDVALGAFNNGSKISVFKNRLLPTATLSGTTIICNTSSVNLSVAFTGAAPPWGFTYSNGTTNTAVSGILTTPYTLTLSPAVTTNYTLVSMTSAYSCTGTVSGSASVTVNPLPTVLTTAGASRCGIGTVVLNGTVSSGSINWYAAATGGPILFTGLSYTTPVLTSNTSFYAEAISPQGCPSAVRTKVDVVVNAVPTITGTTPGNRCNPGTLPLAVTTSIGTADWYTVSSGGTAIATATNTYTTPSLSATATYYVDVTYNGCTYSPRVAVQANVNTTPSITSTTPSARCDAGSIIVSAITTAGTVYWYDAPTAGNLVGIGLGLGIPTLSATTTYYAEGNNNGCLSSTRSSAIATINITPSITSSTPANRCDAGTIAVSAISSAGTISWYAASTGGLSLGTGNSYSIPSLGSTTTYFAEATLAGCTSARTGVTASINLTPTITATTPGSRCTAGIFSLGATASAGTVNWYTAATGGISQGSGITFATPSLSSTTSYYVDATTLAGCTTPARTLVLATINSVPTIASTAPASRCDNGTLTLGATASAGNVNWFAALTGGSSLASGNAFVTPSISASTTYYVEADNGGCTSASRTPVLATVTNTPSILSTTGASRCTVGTLSLVASASVGATINWYVASSGGISQFVGSPFLTPTLSAITQYYVDATLNGCSSPRTVVNADVYATPSITSFTNGNQCNSGTINLQAIPSAGIVNWYTAPTGGTAMGTGNSFITPLLSSTTTYYAEAVVGPCLSASRQPVVASIVTTPTVATVIPGAGCGTSSVALGASSATGILDWYTSAVGGTSLSTGATFNTPIISASTTYYVEANLSGCISARSAVLATIKTVPIFTLSSTNPSPCGTATGTFSILGLSPSTGYSVAFNGGGAQAKTSDGLGTILISAIGAGGYANIIVTGGNGCSTTDITGVALTDPSAPTITSVTQGVRCSNGMVTLGAAASSGVINWYLTPIGGGIQGTGTSFTTPTISTTTTYYVDAINGGCTSGRTAVTATVDIPPSLVPVNGTRCDAGTTSISVTTNVGTINWYTVPFGGTNVATGLSYLTPSISSTTTYYAEGNNNSCTSARVPVVANVVSTPSLSLTAGARCDAGTVGLSGASSGTISWYSVLSGGIVLGTGSTFTTPLISSTTTYYAEANTGACVSVRQSVIATVNITPTISGTTPAARCDAGPISIGASVGAGSVNWYAAATGGASLFNGSIYSISNLTNTTTYYADVTNNGCISFPRTAIIATINATPSVATSLGAARCDVGTLVLNATPSIGATLNWYTLNLGGTAQGSGLTYTTPTIGMTTTYFVDATLNGCVSPRTAVVATVTTTPSVTGVSPGSSCGTGSVTLGASSSTGILDWYASSSGGGSLFSGSSYVISSLSTTTTYYVAASLNGCASPRTAVLATIKTIPTISSTTPNSRCDIGTVTLGATASAGVVNWYAAATGGSIQGTGTSFTTPSIGASATYYAEAVNALCSSIPRIAVVATVNTTPNISAALNVERCGPGILNLTASASAGVVQWFAAPTGGVALATGSNYSTPDINATTNYYVEAANGGCTSSSRALIQGIINNLPNFTLSKIDPTACLLANGSFSLEGLIANAPYIFKYDLSPALAVNASAAGEIVQSNLLSGPYNGIIVTDLKGCVSLPSAIALIDPNAPSIDAGLPQTVCQGDLVTLTASNPSSASLVWSTGETTPTISFVASGSGTTLYSVSATLLGCSSSDNVSVKVRTDQSILNFPSIPAQNVFSPAIILNASSSSLLPVVYTSLDLSVATVSGNTVTIVGPGTALIKASQLGDGCFDPAPDSIQSFIVTGKLNQVLTFGSLPTIAFGDLPFDLGATVNSPNTVIYEISDPSVAKVVNGSAIALQAGTVTVKAYALESSNYTASDTLIQTLKVIVPAFKIFGSSIVQADNKENYFVSPNSPKYAYGWNYKGKDTYFVSDTISRNISLYFKETAVGDTLRCRIYSIVSNTFVEVKMKITVNSGLLYLEPINCDSLKGTLTICSGKYINNFTLKSAAGGISNLNSGCDQGYSDFTRLEGTYTTELYLGESYNAEIEVRNNSKLNLSANYIGAWIDYNKNGSFDDPNEFLVSTYSADSIFELKNLLLSTNESFAGIRRLRIRVRSSGLFTFNESCVDFNESGETEDYKVTLVVPDRLEAPVLLTPNEDGKNDLFIIKGIYTKADASENKFTVLDRMGTILYSEVNYENNWNGKGKDGKLLPRDTYYYNFVNGNGEVIRGYFEIRY